MKRLILLCTAMLAGMDSFEQRISVSLTESSFRNFIREVEKQTPFYFIYTTEQLSKIPSVSVHASGIELFELLDHLLKHTAVGYQRKKDCIVLVTETNKLFAYTGKIINQTGQTLEGISIQTDDGNTIISNSLGEYEIKTTRPFLTLLISGAEIEPIILKNQTPGYTEIEVREILRELDETIVLGYGTSTKRYHTGNVFQIKQKDLSGVNNGNLLYALQGRVPGLLITSTGGSPSSSYLMQIRGQQSLNPNPLINYKIPPVDQPLIIINGVPFAPMNNNISQLPSPASPGSLEVYQNPYGGISPFSIINPSDIENVEILKDATTTSIYGSRAANGIILITTKQASGEKFAGELKLSSGLNFIRTRPQMLSTSQYLQLRSDAFAADGVLQNLTADSLGYAPDLLRFDNNRNINWSRYFFQPVALFSSLHAGFSGKTGRFLISGNAGFRKEDYLLKGNFFSRELSLLHDIKYHSGNKKIQAHSSLYISNGLNRSIGSALILKSISLPPNYPDPYKANGQLNWNYNGIDLSDNPAALLQQPYSISSFNTLASTELQFHFHKKMSLTLNTGFNHFYANEVSLIPSVTLAAEEQKNTRAWFGSSRFNTKVVEPQFSYQSEHKKLSIRTLSGFTLQHYGLSLQTTKNSDFSDGLNLLLTNTEQVDSRRISDGYTYASLFSRADLRYADKYLLHISTRRERSSRFSPNNRTGLFSAIGAGWIFSEEKFIKEKAGFLHFGKIKFSYGTAGNDHIGYYHYLDAWTRAGRYTGNQPLPGGIRDASFSWSVTKKKEVGLELRLFKNRMEFDLAYYDHRSSNQLISQFSSSGSNRSRYISNFPAVVQNNGWEIAAGINAHSRSRVNWHTRLVITKPGNKLKSFPDIEHSLYATHYWIDQPLNANSVIGYTGVNPETGLFTFQFDQPKFININPRIYGGLTGRLQYNKWAAHLFLEFRIQTGINYLRQIYDQPPGMMQNQPFAISNYWNTPGECAAFQKATVQENSITRSAAFLFTLSDAVYSNASFLRFKDMEISYALPNILKGSQHADTRLSLQIQNLITISSFTLTDPEVQSFFSYPQTKTIALRIMMKL